MEDLITTEDASRYLDMAMEMAILYSPRLLLAIVVLVVGSWIREPA